MTSKWQQESLMSFAWLRRRTRISLLAFFALVALIEVASAVQPGDPPYGSQGVPQKRAPTSGLDTPAT